MSLKKTLVLLAPMVTSACLTQPDDVGGEPEPVDVSTQQISGASSPASQFQLDRAVKIPGCTATRISASFAITAAHCGSNVGQTVYFYTTGPGYTTTRAARIEQVILRPGVSAAACHDDGDCEDSSGLFADVALLRLSTNATASIDALGGPQATLAWRYPGEDAAGKKVGAGGHEDNPNPTGILLQVSDTTDFADDDTGKFETTTDDVNPGDSGGPFYVSNRVVGTLWGHGWDLLDGYWARYTSVPKHLNWILSNIGYRWGGTPAQADLYYSGALVEAFTGTERECQYACEKTSSCDAYNYNSILQMCELRTNITSASTVSGYRGALHYGASSSKSNLVVGYMRGDGINSVVHEATNGHLHELFLGSASWSVGDISNNSPPAVAGKISAYRRADGVNAVVYRSTTGRIIEVTLVGGQWDWADLTSWGGLLPVGDPAAYVRADGVSAVVFRSSNGHINELRLGTKGWLATDLTAAAGSSVVASAEPMAYVRSDGISSVVFRAGTDIWELYRNANGVWNWGVPSQIAGAPGAASRPYGFTHKNGTNAIVYRSVANRIIELWIGGSGWTWGDLSNVGGPTPTGNPVAYVRTDGLESVVYRSTGNQIIELANAPWAAYNLSSVTGAGPATTDPSVYIRDDGHNAIVFGIASNHAAEIAWRRGEPQWVAADLTFFAGETP